MLQVWLLGQFQVRVDGKLANIPSRAAQSLLAYLILTAGTPHRREKLAGLLWPEMSDDSARNNLRHELWRVRKAITAPQFGAAQSNPEAVEREYILAEDLSIAFNSDANFWLDVAQLQKPVADPSTPPGTSPEALISSLSLYRGELLPGFYDDWVGLERERVQAVFEGKMHQLLDALVAEQRWQMVLEWGERWISLGQTPEPAYRALMTAHSHLGDASKVAQDYERCLLALREDLNMTPAQETQTLYEELTRGRNTTRVRIAPLPEAFIQPSGPLTCVFTELADAAGLLQAPGEDYTAIITDQREIVRAAAEKFNGLEIDSQSDASFFGFLNVLDAIAFAAETQRAVAAHPWTRGETVGLRMGIHSGEPMRAGISMDLHRAARIASAAHGGQVLVSQTTRELIGDELPERLSLRDLGEHRLKELRYPTELFQLVIEGLPNDFPHLKTLDAQEPPAPGEPPFKGLQYFDESDAALFFGREQLVSKLVSDLNARRFLAVIVGASGSGKSSVIRAGVIPALRRNAEHWQVYVLTPTAHPLEQLAIELTHNSESVTATATLLDDLIKDPRALYLWLRRQSANREAPSANRASSSAISNTRYATRVLLAIDQFEELFTLCRDEVEREMFIDSLLTATSFSDVTLIITIRADFYAHLAQYPELREAVAKQQEYIGPMTSDELRRAIEEPAKQGAADGAAWEFEPGVVDLMLRDVGDEPGALPLLSHALLETWKRRSGHLMTLKGYADAGGVRGAIAHTAETTFQQLSPAQQVIARNIFLRLTELGDATEDTRRRTAMAELVPPGEEGLATRAVLTRLADARLITTSENTAEVAHEALIREWPRLREWLNQDREGLRLHRQLTEAVQEWELLERDPSALYRGARLAQVLEWAVLHPEELNAHEHTFLNASKEQEEGERREREQAQQRELDAAQELVESSQRLAEEQKARAEESARAARRLRQRAYGLAGAFVLALLLAGLALLLGDQARMSAAAAEKNAGQAESERRIATARELAASASNNVTIDPERTMLLALQAIAATASDNMVLTEAESALHTGVRESRVLKTLRGHTAQVWGVAVNATGTRVASISLDGTTKVWDPETGKVLLTLPTNLTSWDGKGALFTADGMRLLTLADGNAAKLWDLDTGKVIFSLEGHSGGISSVAVSPDGSKFATTSYDGAINIWNASSGEKLRTQYEDGEAVFVAFSPDSRRVLTSSYDNKNITRVVVWDAESGEKLVRLENQAGVIYSVAANPDGTRLATSGFASTVKIWDGATGKLLNTLFGHSTLVAEVAFSPDGKLLASASEDGTAKIWDAGTGQELLTLAGHSGGVENLAFTPDGSRLVTASRDSTIRIWDITPGGDREWLTLLPANERVKSAVYSPDGTRIATSGSEGILQVWDAVSGKPLFQIAADQEQPQELWTGRVSYSADGKRIVTDGVSTPRVFDAESGKPLLTLATISEVVTDVAFSPDVTRIAVADDHGTLRIYDSATGQMLLNFVAHTAAIQKIAYSPDGTRIATGGDDGRAQVFDARSGNLLLKIELFPNRVLSIAYSPDGNRFATAHSDGTVKVWDALSGSELFTLRGHTGQTPGLAFSPDGQELATASADRTIKVWKLPSAGEQLQEPLTLYGHSGGVYHVVFSPDGTRLLSASRDGTARVFAVRLQDLIELAKAKLTRGLTADECEKFLHIDQCPAEK